MTGAAALAARAAFRADAGYVAIAAPEESLPVLETLVVEAVKKPLTEVAEAAKRASALAIGPGWVALTRRSWVSSPGDGLAGGARRGRLVRARAVSAFGPDGAHAARGRARAAPRRGLVVGRRAPARSRAACGRRVLVHRRAQGAPTRSSARRTERRSSSRSVLRRSRSPARATCSRACSAPSSRRGSRRGSASAAAVAAQQLAAAHVSHQAGLVAGDVVEALPAVLSRREGALPPGTSWPL